MCTRRLLDEERLKEYFRRNGSVFSPGPEDADYILLVTCAFVGSKEDDCFELLREFSRYRGELVVVGCLPEIASSRLEREFGGRTVSTKELEKIDELFPQFEIGFATLPDANYLPDALQSSTRQSLGSGGPPSPAKRARSLMRKLARPPAGYRSQLVHGGRALARAGKERVAGLISSTRNEMVYLRVTNGCANNCSYCGILKAIGPLRSKPLEVCEEEYRRLLDTGCTNIKFLGEDVGSWGLDLSLTLPQLLERLWSIRPGDGPGWNFESIYPSWAIAYRSDLLRFIKQGRVREICCEAQSGSPRILQRMKRRYSIDDLGETLRAFKKADPRVALRTHLIVGFPSETEEDFQASLDFVTGVGFSHVYLFSYSDREGTGASAMDGKIPSDVIRERMERARQQLLQQSIPCETEDSFLIDWEDRASLS